MKRELTCTACRQLLGEPDLVDGVYYFVCGACGTVREVQQQTYDADLPTLLRRFEEEYQVTLPDSYKQFVSDDSRVQQHYEAPIEGPVPTTLAYFIENNTVSIGGFYSPDPLRPMSLFSSGYLCEEWQLPKGLVLISGDGHTWIALDYRSTQTDPPVVFVESDSCEHVLIAKSFTDLLRRMRSPRDA